MKTPFFLQKIGVNLQPSTPSTFLPCRWWIFWDVKTTLNPADPRAKPDFRFCQFCGASLNFTNWGPPGERGMGGVFGKFSAFGRCFASHQSVTLQSAWKGFCRFFVADFFSFCIPNLLETNSKRPWRFWPLVVRRFLLETRIFGGRRVRFKDCTFPSCNWYIQIYTQNV